MLSSRLKRKENKKTVQAEEKAEHVRLLFKQTWTSSLPIAIAIKDTEIKKDKNT